jgi:hypothetical protein
MREVVSNTISQPRRFAWEVSSHPVPGHKAVQPVAADAAGFQVVQLPLDFPPGATELFFQFISEPGVIEIRRLTLLQNDGSGGGSDFDADAMKTMLRVLSGGVAIFSDTGTVLRILASDEPVVFILSNFYDEKSAPPCAVRIEFRHRAESVAAAILSAPVLNAFNADHNDLAIARRELAEVRAELDKVRWQFEQQSLFLKRVERAQSIACHSGTVLDFTDRGNALPFHVSGWSAPEPWGTWTEGRRATLNIRFAVPPERGCTMRVLAHALIHASQPQVRVDVSVNGENLATWILKSSKNSEFRIKIPAEKLRQDVCEITFDIPNPKSPAELGISSDARRLGIGVVRVDFQNG